MQEGRKASPSWGKLLVLICQVNRKYGCGLEQWAVMISNKAMAKVLNKKFQVMDRHERDHLGLAVVTLLRGNLLIVHISFSRLFLAPPPLSWCGGLESNVDFLFLFWGQLAPGASPLSWKSIHQLVSWWGLWGSGRGHLELGSQGEALLQITLWHPQISLNLESICYHCTFHYECQHFRSPV